MQARIQIACNNSARIFAKFVQEEVQVLPERGDLLSGPTGVRGVHVDHHEKASCAFEDHVLDAEIFGPILHN